MTKRIILLLAFLEGGLVMLLELVIPHVLSPVLGSSMETWAKLILLSVGGLAIGYFLGGFLSKKKVLPNLFTLLVIAFASSLVAFIIIWLSNQQEIFSNEVISAYLIAFTGLFLPSICLASTTPLLIQEMSERSNSTGLLFSNSTWGGILFTILTGFAIIPNFGLVKSLQLFLLLISVMILLVTWKSDQNVRKTISYAIFLIAFLILIFGSSTPEANDLEVLQMKEGLNGQLLAVEKKVNDTINERTLFINRMGQTWIRVINGNSVASVWSYPVIIKSLASYHGKTPSSALVLGLGGGIVPLFLADKSQLNYTIDAVELDKDIVNIAQEYFFLTDAVNVIEDDARRYLNSNKQKYDLIVMDIFNGEIAPSHVLSLEALQEIKRALSPNGFVVINFNGHITGEAGISARSLWKTLLASGFQVNLLPTYEKGERNKNNLFIASQKQLDFSKFNLPINYIENNQLKEYSIKKNLINPKKVNLNDAFIISDNYPLMEQLNQTAARQWREDYLKNITLKFRNKGIPLIK
jgi:predicted membrane-bound spermidine synthase